MPKDPNLKIHIYCRQFAPAVGGMERLIETLAREFVASGHVVHVVTETPGDAELPFPVYRRPGFLRYVRLARDGDVILSAPLSLRRLPAQLLSRRKIFLSHPERFGGTGLQGAISLLKWRISRYLVNIVPSQFMAGYYRDPRVILNPYDDKAFFPPPGDATRRGAIFVGRLEPRKGCHLLIEGFSRIAGECPGHDLTVVGGGPQAAELAEQARALGIADRVRFTGVVRGPALTALMQAHAVMVVPSIMDEPFGIVALEGLACGCRMVVSRTGGLPEAVGPFALMFDNGDVAGLTSCLRDALRRGPVPGEEEEVRSHLDRFSSQAVAAKFLAVLGGA